jgi:penicillin amidase
MKRRSVFRWTLRIVASLVVLIVVVAVAGYFWLRTSLPKLDGEVAVEGLRAPVEIVRDRNAVPHIFAGSETDAAFALGYVHAQDRLLQMEMMRRLGAGRLAEVAGPRALRIDRMFRTFGLYRKAEATLPHLAPEMRAALEAYAAGVNAYLKTHKGALPPEFLLLGIDPEPWRPADSLVWGRIMAVRLSTNWQNELLRAFLETRIGADKLAVLWPPQPGTRPATISDNDRRRTELYRRSDIERALAALPKNFFGGASNAWAISGKLTTTGKPILANDPHLQISAPILWYLARIDTPTRHLVGATAPGVPLTILGHNGHIAWGVTATYADTDDVYIERIDPAHPDSYQTPGGPKPFDVRKETLKVRGGPDVTLTIRETRHGPVLNDLFDKKEAGAIPAGNLLVLSAPWLRTVDRTAEAIYRIDKARNWDEFTEALRSWQSPPQNVMFAATNGDIGIFTPGLIPTRRSGEGFMPTEGWKAENGWNGFIPFDALPHLRNPASGRIVNANNRLVGPDYPYFISRSWGDHYRAQRINALLDALPKHSLDTAARIQSDPYGSMAQDLLPLMLAAKPRSDAARAAVERLRAWNRRMTRGRPEPLLFAAWLRELNRALYADELGDTFKRYWSVRPDVVKAILTAHHDWCDDVTTAAKESCDDRIALALDRALADLKRRFGDDPAAWKWGDAHYADLRNSVLSFIPIVRSFADLRIAANGGNFTINKAAFSVRNDKAPFAQREGPGYRAIYDLSNLDNSRFMIATGQSGNLLSPYYGSFVHRWRDVKYIHIAGSRDEVKRHAIGILRLVPAGTKKPDGKG